MHHNGTETRIVLIVDVWHPEMDEDARRAALLSSQHRRDEVIRAYRQNLAAFGKENWF